MWPRKDNRNITDDEQFIDDEEMEETDEEIDSEKLENVLKLQCPIMINDELVRELEYDFSELTAKNIHEISKQLKNKGIVTTLPALDIDFQTLFFAKAVAKKMPNVFLTDIYRMKACDLMKAVSLSRSFLLNVSSDGDMDLTSGK